MEETRYKILLLEDDRLDQMAFERMVKEKKLPYDCTVAGSLAQARSIIEHKQFDIVIADYMLGDGTALDLLNLIKSTPVILVTGAGDEEVAVQAWKSGAYDYLIKDRERNYLKAVPITVENAVKHRKTTEKLRLLSHAIVSTDDSVYITDLYDKITFVNKAFCRTYGHNEEQIIGKDANILWKDSPLAAETINIYRAVNGWEVGFFHKRRDGTEFPVSLSRSNVKDETGSDIAVVVITRDISERMQIENELRSLNQELEKQNRLKKELAVTVYHQLMTPINELKNTIATAMAGTWGKINTKLYDNLKSTERNADKAKDIINDFLDVSQIEMGTMKLELSELGLRLLVSQFLKALYPLACEKDIELEGLIPDSNLDIDPDWDRIVRVLAHFVNNTKQVAMKGHNT